LKYSFQILDKFKVQEKEDKKEKEKEATNIILQLAATAAKQPSNLSGLSSKELLVFKFSF
jgi:hypothetical protein